MQRVDCAQRQSCNTLQLAGLGALRLRVLVHLSRVARRSGSRPILTRRSGRHQWETRAQTGVRPDHGAG